MLNLKSSIFNLLCFKEPEKIENFILAETNIEKNKTNNTNPSIQETSKKAKIQFDLNRNLKFIKKKYRVPLNGDLIIREFEITITSKVVKAFITFYDGMVDNKIIDNHILQPLMLISNNGTNKIDIPSAIRNKLMTHNQIKEVQDYSEMINGINYGGCGIFIDGINTAFIADVKGFEHRTVGKPVNEQVIRGPQEGFNEVIGVNNALIRKRLNDEDLIVENMEIGERSKTLCSMLYIFDIANDSLVEEVRTRLKSLKIDYLIDSGELEQLIEDSSLLASPQMVATERPDRVASMLTQGRVAVVVNGSPFVLVMPNTIYDLIHSSEDNYLRFPYGNMLRVVRMLGIFCALLLPSFYIAITNYHNEMIPTSLLLAIEASRERVPFPSVIEIFLMEVSFELIREAGIRIPGPIGPTLGIIGALILGQAAVAANIVSPILIIIVAVTGLGSFSIPSFSLAFSFRLIRFAYIMAGMLAGFLGITTGMFIHGLFLVNAKSFGVPFFSPYAPKTSFVNTNEVLNSRYWKNEKRPDYLNPKDISSQPEISRGWKKTFKKGKKQNGK